MYPYHKFTANFVVLKHHLKAEETQPNFVDSLLKLDILAFALFASNIVKDILSPNRYRLK